MPDKEDKEENGNGGNGKKSKPVGIVETPEEKRERVYENRRGQYVVFRLAKTLNIDSTKKPPKSAMMVFETDGIYFNLVEIMEKALRVIEGK